MTDLGLLLCTSLFMFAFGHNIIGLIGIFIIVFCIYEASR